MMTHPRPAASLTTDLRSQILLAIIVLQGIATVFLSLVLSPLGIVLVAVNAVLAFAVRGAKRRLFAGFAVLGGVFCIAGAIFLIATGGPSPEVTQLERVS